jgi:hypothetical protein
MTGSIALERSERNHLRRRRNLATSQLETEQKMTISIAHLQPIVSLIAGVLILIVPQLLNYIVAAFLIVSGVLGLGLLH